jgi:hypothetical protein
MDNILPLEKENGEKTECSRGSWKMNSEVPVTSLVTIDRALPVAPGRFPEADVLPAAIPSTFILYYIHQSINSVCNPREYVCFEACIS